MGNIHQLRVRDELRRGQPGQLMGRRDLMDTDCAKHTNGSAAQTNTITIDSASEQDYSVIIEGQTITYSAGSGDSTSDIASGLKDELEDDPIAYGLFSFEVSSNVVTATAENERISIDIEGATSDLTVAESQAAGSEDPIDPGLWVKWDGAGGVQLAEGSTARDLEVTVDNAVNSQEYWMYLEVEDEVYEIFYTADGSATEDEILTGIKADIDGFGLDDLIETSLDTSASPSELHVTSANEGFNDFRFTSWHDDLAVTADAGGDLEVAGVTCLTYDEEHESASGESPSTPYWRHVYFLRRGRVLVEGGDAASRGDTVYVGTSASELGKSFAAQSSSDDRLKLPASVAVWAGPNELEVYLGV